MAPCPATLDELDAPLREVAFCVIDLESTGSRPDEDGIIEVAALRVRGGELEGCLHTLVDPGRPVPPPVRLLTGIDDSMLTGAPRFETLLPPLLELARGAVVVAHNARFDVGFVEAALARSGRPGLQSPVVCTVALATRALTGEVPDRRLATLAAHLRCPHRPRHRALPDARATVDVLHGLIERLTGFGVTRLRHLLEVAAPGR